MITTYNHLKRNYPDAVLLLQIGDTIQTTGNDAKEVKDLCNDLTTETINRRTGTLKLPAYLQDVIILRMIKRGRKIAIAAPVNIEDDENLRQCDKCKKAMEEGYIMNGTEYYCSDNCLPITPEQWNEQHNSNPEDNYFTSWED